MAAVFNPNTDETARKIVSEILQRLASVGQIEVAKTLDVSEATVSRLKDQVPQFAGMLVRLGLKVIPAELEVYDREEIGAVLVLAKRAMDAIHSPEHLAARKPAPE